MRTRKSRILFKFGVLLTLFLILGLMFVNSNTFREQLKNQITSKVNQMTGGRSSIGRVQVRFFPPRIEINQLTIQGSGIALSRPLLSVQRIEARPRLRSLLGVPQLISLELIEPIVYLEVNSDGS